MREVCHVGAVELGWHVCHANKHDTRTRQALAGALTAFRSLRGDQRPTTGDPGYCVVQEKGALSCLPDACTL